MEFDLRCITSTPDIRCIPQQQVKLVCALRYVHKSRHDRSYRPEKLAVFVGSMKGVQHFHVLLDEIGRAWPETIYLNCPCQPQLSYDEMLIVDLMTAAGGNDRRSFDRLIEDMVAASMRNAIWCAARKFQRCVSASAPPPSPYPS